MALQFKNPLGSFRLPFFMVDLGNYETIVLPNVPLTIASAKPINWANTDIPGMPFQAKQFGSFGAMELSMSVKLANRNPIMGNLPMLKQFEKLRTPVEGLFTLIFNQPNNANPQVLFWYGAGTTLPLIYYVTECEFEHLAFNQMGYPTITDISLSLSLDEDTYLYDAERIARMVLSIAGMADSIYSLIQSFMGKKPY